MGKDSRGELLRRMRELERTVDELEKDFEKRFKKVDFSNLADEFIVKVLDDYWSLLDNQVREMEVKLNSTLFDKDDLMQEVFEYLLRWCLPTVREKSTKYLLWVPYLKRSLQNCFINLAQKKYTKRRLSNVVELTQDIIDSYVDTQSDTESDYEFEELVSSVRRRLSERDRKIFDNVLNPTLSFNGYCSVLRAYYKKIGKKFSYRKVVAEYFDLPPNTVNYTFNRIRKVIKEVSAQKEFV